MMVRETLAESNATTTVAPKLKLSETQKKVLNAVHRRRFYPPALATEIARDMHDFGDLRRDSCVRVGSVLKELSDVGLVSSFKRRGSTWKRFAITAEGQLAIARAS